MKKQTLVLLVMVFSAIGLAGCAAKPPEPVTFTIDMTEYAFSPEKLEVKVGQQVTIDLINSGQLAHEIMFGRDVVMVDHRPSGYEHDMFEEAGVEPMVMGFDEEEHMEEGDEHMDGDEHEEDEHMDGDDHAEDEHVDEDDHAHAGFMVHLQETGDQGSISFTVTEDMLGEWEIGCFLLDGVHYTSGMVGTFVVTR